MTTTNNVNHRGYYSNVWPNWVTKALGPQPTNDQLAVIHGLKARPGKQALAISMSLRECGVTGAQIKGAVALIDGGANPQLNKMRGLVDAGMLAWVPMPQVGGGKVYRTKLTALGQQMVKGNAASPVHVTTTLAAKADKAKGNGKPKAPVTKAKARKRPSKPAGAAKPVEATQAAPQAAKPANEAPKPVTGLEGFKAQHAKPVEARTVLTNDGPKPVTPATK